jgi:putative intracellular protease/amidase
MARFKQDAAALKAFANTVKLADVKAEDYDTLFYTGGHGPMWDLAQSPVSIAILEAFYKFRQTNRLGLPFAWDASPC